MVSVARYQPWPEKFEFSVSEYCAVVTNWNEDKEDTPGHGREKNIPNRSMSLLAVPKACIAWGLRFLIWKIIEKIWFSCPIEARKLVGVDPENIHLFLQGHQLIFETKSNDHSVYYWQGDFNSCLFLRQSNVDEDSLVAKVSNIWIQSLCQKNW